jgi:hypothetical protein
MQKVFFGEVLSKINLVEYTDIQGLKKIFDRQNKEDNTTKQSIRMKNIIPQKKSENNIESNKQILLDDIVLNFGTKQDKGQGKSKVDVSVKYKEAVILEFEIEDTGDMILLHGKDFFNEYIGIEKKKIENIVNWISEAGTVNLGNIEILRDMYTKVNDKREQNIFEDIEKIIGKAKEYLQKEIEELDPSKIEARTNVPTKYQGRDLKVDNITITLKKQEYKDILTRVYNKTMYYIQKNKSEFPMIDTLSLMFTKKEDVTKGDTIKLNTSITLNNTGKSTLTSEDNETNPNLNNNNKEEQSLQQNEGGRS